MFSFTTEDRHYSIANRVMSESDGVMSCDHANYTIGPACNQRRTLWTLSILFRQFDTCRSCIRSKYLAAKVILVLDRSDEALFCRLEFLGEYGSSFYGALTACIDLSIIIFPFPLVYHICIQLHSMVEKLDFQFVIFLKHAINMLQPKFQHKILIEV